MMHAVLMLFSLLLSATLQGQPKQPFSVQLEPLVASGFPGIQSYAFGRAGDFVLFVGGRTEGVHQRQPFAAFNKQFNHADLLVLDLKTGQHWKRPVTNLPGLLADQLQSTNMAFSQTGNELILVGGYGYSNTHGRFMTYPSLVRIKVAEMIDAIMQQGDPATHIEQLSDERMAVTGGRLGMLNGLFYLVGGHRFEGRYNPHGPDHGPGFVQQYTNQVRTFRLLGKGDALQLTAYAAITDTGLLHRRDYNLVNQYDARGRALLTLYSGVFRTDQDLPYTSLVDVTASGIREVRGFEQRFSHYHTAVLPLYSRLDKTMYTIFFGGIAMYHADSTGQIIRDERVPFVKHISLVERSGETVKESLLPLSMPGFMGAGAEFIPAREAPFSAEGILELDRLKPGDQPVGYIVGGIHSQAPNVFWKHQANGSIATPMIFKVLLTK